MPIVSIVTGLFLVGLAVWGKVSTGTPSWTPLIPAFLGGPLMVCGLVALKESLLKHAMHAAAMLGLLGFLGGAANLGRMLAAGKNVVEEPAGVSTLTMTVASAAFVALCVNSFVQARRRRAAREAGNPAGQP